MFLLVFLSPLTCWLDYIRKTSRFLPHPARARRPVVRCLFLFFAPALPLPSFIFLVPL